MNLELDLDENNAFGPEENRPDGERTTSTNEGTPSPGHRENNFDREELIENQDEDSANESDIEIENQLTQTVTSPPELPPASTRVLRDRSQIRPPVRYGFHHYYEPNTFESAIRCTDAKH